jgi:hypothetical protein
LLGFQRISNAEYFLRIASIGQSIPFESYGMSFSVDNTFIAQISDQFCSFANPVNIGSTPYVSGSGTITVTFPANFSRVPRTGFELAHLHYSAF